MTAIRVVCAVLVEKVKLESREEYLNQGATAVEYALMVGGIAVAVVATTFVFGDQISAIFQAAVDGLMNT